MKGTARLLLVALVVVSVLVVPNTSDAHTSGGGDLGPDYVRATAADLGAGTFSGGGIPARAPSEEPHYVWARANDARFCVEFASPWPAELAVHITPRPYAVAGGVPIQAGPFNGDHPTAWLLDDLALLPPDARVIGPLVWDFGRSIAGDGDLIILPWCPTPGAPVPWEPPTAAEIWEQTPLPRREIGASPPGTRAWPGITRLATFFWSDPRPPTTAAVSLRGFDVTVTARPIAYAWTFGDGSTQLAGDPPSAIVHYIRRTTYDVTLYVVWEARARLVYAPWGIDLGDIDLGTVTLPETRPYHVAEVRAVLRTTPGRR